MRQDQNNFEPHLYLQNYVQYIRKTRQVPLPVAKFDYDWEPIGPLVRRDMLSAGIITINPDGIRITEPQENHVAV